jgi:hypothetical protein
LLLSSSQFLLLDMGSTAKIIWPELVCPCCTLAKWKLTYHWINLSHVENETKNQTWIQIFLYHYCLSILEKWTIVQPMNYWLFLYKMSLFFNSWKLKIQ